ncbi:MAG TPA: 2-succinyl-6-hydroxy-2,4-cyclohexadiene-1-carboxylate synthase [Ktedonobacteraceae bacterium]|nr:2-succinyl-6-hydroxy-2,4-cyclohexadiene-1-carboxylate synthase [Ktedonobacteraceae bacterium]
MESRRIPVNGLHFGVILSDEIQAGQETLVLLHGFTGSAANWGNLFPHLQKRGRQLIAIDMLGHGQSDAPDDPERYSIAHCQADILALMEILGVSVNQAILLGYSMGGRIALYTAFSGFFRALVLESASAGLSDSLERQQRQQNDNELASRIEREGVEDFIDYWEHIPLFASQENLSDTTRAALRAQRLRNQARGLAHSLRGVGTGVQPDLYGKLHELNLPVLLLAGSLDLKFCQIARQMAGLLPQAQLRIVQGAGHTIHLERPEYYIHLVNAFCLAV